MSEPLLSIGELSLRECSLCNPSDCAAADGPGPRYLIAGNRPSLTQDLA